MKIVKFFIILTLLLSQQTNIFAQQPNLPCGTIPGKSSWLKDYQADPSRFRPILESRGASTMYLPVTIQIVGTDDSLGMAGLDAVLLSFCELNQDFAASGIQFFIEPPIRYVYETAFYRHDSVKAGGIRMLQNNVANTINVYFVADPAGNCGYNLPYAGIAMNNGCISGHTFAHEMGHCLSMPHTFLGWEGGIGWGGNPVQSFNGPAPERVTINYTDFKDTLFLNDTLIIDTVYVEKVARSGASSNCSNAADGFCDTPSDYLAFRWPCSSQNSISSTIQYDPDTVSFRSDGWYIMSYAYDDCQVGFSQEQIDAMKSYVLTEKPNWLYNQSPNVDSVGVLQPIQPLAGSIVSTQNPIFSWNAVEGATHYFLEVYKEPYAVNQILERVVLTDTFYQMNRTLQPRPASFPYAWRLMPYNYGNTCRGYNQPINFNTALSSSVLVEDVFSEWDIRPNPVNVGTSLKLYVPVLSDQNVELNIYNAAGIKVWNTDIIKENATDFEILIPQNWSNGLYFAELRNNRGARSVKKFMVK